MTPVEVMACGKPVIATDVGGVGEIIDDGENIMPFDFFAICPNFE